MTTTNGPAQRRPMLAAVRRSVSSIRVRIVVGYALLLAVAIGVAVVVTRQVQLARLDRAIEQDLAQEIDELRRLAGSGPGAADPTTLFDSYLAQNVAGDHEAFYTVPVADGAPVADAVLYSFDAPLRPAPETAPLDDAVLGPLLREWAAVTEPTHGTLETPIGEMRTLAVPIFAGATVASADPAKTAQPATGPATGVFVAAYFPDAEQADVARLVRLLALAGLGLAVVTTGLAWSLAGRIVAPVRALTRTARGITDSDLSARIPVEGHDEVAELGTTFNEMVDRLDRGFRAQRQFVDDIAHDLRTPLTVARGHLELLSPANIGGDDPTERSETVSIVLDELDRMGRLVSDLMVLAKAEQPDFLRLQLVDFGDVAADLLQRATALGDRAWVLDEAPPPGVLAGVADPDRLVQAVLNLAANAVQHTAAGDEIGIGVSAVGPAWNELPPGTIGSPHSVRLWVRDTGPGVDPALLDGDGRGRLFQRHGRGAASRARRDGRMQEGMGLGLSIVDAIARAHHGAVSHTSTNDAGTNASGTNRSGTGGRGATFTLEIPLDQEPEP